MFDPDQYELIDFGEGRRLERFGPMTLDRPCPAAERIPKADRALWATADWRFDRDANDEEGWRPICAEPTPAEESHLPFDRWTITHGDFAFELKPTGVGHLGLFPEQYVNWDWLAEFVRSQARPPRILNLFAYTGGSTLAAASAGADVTHLDAAKNVVAWARRNAELSDLADASIRWIGDDARKFVKREIKRGRRYDAVILDPPSYGHGSRGEVWRLARHLPRLLDLCIELITPTDEAPLPSCDRFVLLTCHTPGYDPQRIADILQEACPSGEITPSTLTLRDRAGRELYAGDMARWVERA